MTGMIEEFFLLGIFDSRIFRIHKFGKYIFGWLDVSRDFLGYFSCYMGFGFCPFSIIPVT